MLVFNSDRGVCVCVCVSVCLSGLVVIWAEIAEIEKVAQLKKMDRHQRVVWKHKHANDHSQTHTYTHTHTNRHEGTYKSTIKHRVTEAWTQKQKTFRPLGKKGFHNLRKKGLSWFSAGCIVIYSACIVITVWAFQSLSQGDSEFEFKKKVGGCVSKCGKLFLTYPVFKVFFFLHGWCAYCQIRAPSSEEIHKDLDFVKL